MSSDGQRVMTDCREDQQSIEAWISGYVQDTNRVDLHVLTGAAAGAFPRAKLDGMRISRALRKAKFNRSYEPGDGVGCIYRRNC